MSRDLFSAARAGQPTPVCAGKSTHQKTTHTDPLLNQCSASVADGGPTLNQHWIHVLCLLARCWRQSAVAERCCNAAGLTLSLPWWHRKALTQWPPFLNVIVPIRPQVYACWKWPNFHRHLKYSSQFFGIRVFCKAARVSFLHSWLCEQNGGQCDWASRSKWIRRPSHTGYSQPTTLKYFCINHGDQWGFSM